MATELSTILKLSVPLIVRIGVKRMSLDDVLALGPGAIMDLEKSADDELELLVNNKRIGRGEAVKLGENFGIRVNAVEPAEQRVKAMGEHPAAEG